MQGTTKEREREREREKEKERERKRERCCYLTGDKKNPLLLHVYPVKTGLRAAAKHVPKALYFEVLAL
jgi:hypothetical protein